MSSLISVIAGSRRRFDPDALAYFSGITAAGSSITDGNKLAVDAFIKGCKADGIWSAIKASCLLAGPDNLTGALVPLVGAAPTNNGFVSGDYSRTTGLIGDGISKYLNSNRNNNADPRDLSHLAVWVTTANTAIGYYAASNLTVSGGNGVLVDPANTRIRFWNREPATTSVISGHTSTGLIGVSRSLSASYIARKDSSNNPITTTSALPESGNVYLFARNSTSGSGTAAAFGNGRISFYSIGENLDLALLDARLATYMSSLT